MSEAFLNAREKTITLMKKNGCATAWADNLFEGSKGLVTKRDWEDYYRFLTDTSYKGGAPEDDIEAQMPPENYQLDPRLEEVTYQRGGGEVFIHVKRKTDDEKSLSIEEKENDG